MGDDAQVMLCDILGAKVKSPHKITRSADAVDRQKVLIGHSSACLADATGCTKCNDHCILELIAHV